MPDTRSETATIVINVRVSDGHDDDFRKWQTRMSDVIKTFDGYVGSEIVPPSPPIQPDWVIIHRFANRDQLHTWLDSAERGAMLAEVRPILESDDATSVFLGPGSPESEPVTAVIRTHLGAGNERAFRAWHRRVVVEESKFEGFAGCELQPPVEGFQDEWVTLLRFDSQEHLDRWLESPKRQKLVAEARQFVDDTSVRKVSTSFGGWFRFAGADAPAPKAWKQTMIVLLALYPVVMLEIMFVYPMLEWLDIAPATFVGNALSVSALGFVLVSRGSRAMAWWLSPSPDAAPSVTRNGVLVLIAAYAVTIGFFWWFSNAVVINPVTNL